MSTALDRQLTKVTTTVVKRICPAAVIQNDENLENGQSPMTKRRRMAAKSGIVGDLLSNSSSSCDQRDDVDTAAAPSVKELKGWLSDFEKQQKEHYEKNNTLGKRPAVANDKLQSSAQGLINSGCTLSTSSDQKLSSQNGVFVKKKATILTPFNKTANQSIVSCDVATARPAATQLSSTLSSAIQAQPTADGKNATGRTVCPTPSNPSLGKPVSKNDKFATACRANEHTGEESGKNRGGAPSDPNLANRISCGRSTFSPQAQNAKPCMKTATTSSSKLSTATVAAQKPTSCATVIAQPMSLATPGTISKPVRFKPRVKKEEVQATDEKHASVQKLAEWLQDDPFEKRKLRAIRKGMQVIEKSRAFESEVSVVVAKDAAAGNIRQNGNVADRQKWLKNAFRQGEEEEETMEPPSKVSEKAKWLEKAFKKKPGVKTPVVKPTHNAAADPQNAFKIESSNNDRHDKSFDGNLTTGTFETSSVPEFSSNESIDQESLNQLSNYSHPKDSGSVARVCDVPAVINFCDEKTSAKPVPNYSGKKTTLTRNGHDGKGNDASDLAVEETALPTESKVKDYAKEKVHRDGVEGKKEAKESEKKNSFGSEEIKKKEKNTVQVEESDSIAGIKDSARRSGSAGESTNSPSVLQAAAATRGAMTFSSVQSRKLALEQKERELEEKRKQSQGR